jgi:hypothetical protein
MLGRVMVLRHVLVRVAHHLVEPSHGRTYTLDPCIFPSFYYPGTVGGWRSPCVRVVYDAKEQLCTCMLPSRYCHRCRRRVPLTANGWKLQELRFDEVRWPALASFMDGVQDLWLWLFLVTALACGSRFCQGHHDGVGSHDLDSTSKGDIEACGRASCVCDVQMRPCITLL